MSTAQFVPVVIGIVATADNHEESTGSLAGSPQIDPVFIGWLVFLTFSIIVIGTWWSERNAKP